MIEWNEGLSLGIKALDDDHKKLLDIINELSHAISNDEAKKFIESIFDELQNYATDHFHREEELLKKCGCKKLDEHIKQHLIFSKKIPDLKAKFLLSKEPYNAEEISFFLTDWLFNHIIEEDIPAITMFEKCGLTKEKKEKSNFLTKIITKTTNKFSFTRRILLSALTPLIGMLLFGTIILLNNYNKYEDMRKTSAITNIISNIDELVHTIQIERGLSSGFLTSAQDKFKDTLNVQRTIVDMATNEFLEKIKTTEIKNIYEIQPYINTFKTDISSINKLRKDIDGKVISQARTIDKYTSMIGNILSITPKVAFLNLDREVSSSIATLSSIQHLKESLGQERAFGTMIIEQKDATLKEYITFTRLIGTQKAFLSTFAHTASGSQKHTNKMLRDSNIAKQVRLYEDSIEIHDFKNLDTEIWFKSMTTYINKIKLFEDELLSDINILIEKRINDTIRNLLLWLSFTTAILVITLSILYTFKKSTKFQIYQLTNAMKDLATGGRSLRLSPIHVKRDELAYMYDAYETTRQKLLKGDIYTQLYLNKKEMEIQSHQRENVKLEVMAFIDPLTGAVNRRKFEELSMQELERSNRYNSDLSFLMLDIDHFKSINDTYGHAAGDEILKHFASICLDMARSLDIVARVGGEEFVVMLPETTIDGAYIFAERFRKEIYTSEVTVDEQIIKYSVSIGIAILDNDKDVKDILQRADKALYKAKESGRNCTIVYK
ncbi:diguanylate cyclase [Sulfurimonas gotlandica GD1]|uniref:diguanylate cyclase n=1 Tax=Sulfurimonas gotlandica (strain DSM 19862 / JCM 16533 / GD1) TaxID=929558 RepID=B6BID2_SULGG|nr:bacteriohemerythrin [Sulfurimonas gotlandica]EDZ62889.1 ggdef domain protein protein [Sulfurimonas gotlandica GD1]EHP30285.1 diguanylate cyclase [Sulfurimonas gotlandica GD1]